MPRLSVIVPVYNTEKYLRECIDSILAQTFTDFELILVDDGSTDGSGAICDAYAQKDPRIRVVHQENGGVTVARKTAMKMAEGGWVSFVDSDDWISPAMFDTMMKKVEEHGAEIVVCDAFMEFPDKSEIAGSFVKAGFYDKSAMTQKIYPTMIMSIKDRRPGMTGWLCNKIFDRALLDKVFWSVDDSFVFSEDGLCCYAALLKCESIYVFHIPLYHYRQHMESAMHQYNGEKRYAKLLKAYKAHEEMLAIHGALYLEQMYDFVAVNTITNLRNVLLFDKETPLFTRFSQARKFVSHPMIRTSLRKAIHKHKNRKEKLKTYLALHKCACLLYFLFAIKEKSCVISRQITA